MYLSHKTTRRILEATFGLGTPALGDFKDASATPTANITPVSVALFKTSVTPSDIRTGVIPVGSEPAPAGYSRVALTTANWTTPVITPHPTRNSCPTTGSTTITFTKLNPADDWGTIGWVALYDATPSVVWAANIGSVNMGPNQVNGLTISPGNLALQFHPITSPSWGAEQKFRFLSAIAKGTNITVTPFTGEYTLWSGNQVLAGAAFDYFDSPGAIANVRACTVGIYLAYNDAGTYNTTLTTDNTINLLTYPINTTFPGYFPSTPPSLIDAASVGPQPIRFQFHAAASGLDTNWVGNVREIKFPVATAAWNFPSNAVLAVVNWRWNTATSQWHAQRVIAVAPAPGWTVPLGSQLTIPIDGLKLRAD